MPGNGKALDGDVVPFRSTLKVCLCIVDGLLERRSELVGLVASVQRLVKEELEFLLYVLRIKQMIQP